MAEKIEKDAIRATVGMLRINYPKGTRVELIKWMMYKLRP